MKINKVNIGLTIEQRLNELNMSKAEFGRLIGIPQQNVNRILTRVSIDTDKLIEISEALQYNFFKEYFDDSAIISADRGSIAAGGSITGTTTIGEVAKSTITNNFGEGCNDGKPSPIVQTLTESVATLTRELETSQEQKSRLIGIIEKLTEK
jgi:hypothetical protein